MRRDLYYLNDTVTHIVLLRIGIIRTTDSVNRERFLSSNYHPFFLIEIGDGKRAITRAEMLLLIRLTRNYRVGQFTSDKIEAKYWGWKADSITLKKDTYGWSCMVPDVLGLSRWKPALGVTLSQLFESEYF